jgi:hypothetical protein
MSDESDDNWAWIICGFLVGVFIAVVLTAMNGCGGAEKPVSDVVEPVKVYIIVNNDTDKDFYGTVTAGLMARDLAVPAHGESGFWGYRSMLPEKVYIRVTDKPAPARRK